MLATNGFRETRLSFLLSDRFQEIEQGVEQDLLDGKIQDAVKRVCPDGTSLYFSLSPGATKILKAQLEKGDFEGAVEMAKKTLNSGNYLLVAEKLKEIKPTDLEMLSRLEKSIEKIDSFFRKIILIALIHVYKALGKTDEITRLRTIVAEIRAKEYSDLLPPVSFAAIKRMGAIYAGLLTTALVCGEDLSVLPVAGCAGLAVSGAILSPTIRKPENLLGIAAGLTVAEFGALPALGVGLGTAFLARIPVIQNLAKNSIVGTVKVLGFMGEKTANFVVNAGDLTFRGIEKGVEKMGQGLEKMADAGGFLLSKGASTVSNIVSGIFNGAGKVVSGIDRSLDYLASSVSS